MTQIISDPTRRLGGLALALFDGSAALHRLPDKARRILQAAAVYYAAGRQIDPARPGRAGRDLALAAPLDDFTPGAQALIACAVALQRDKVRPQREPAFLALGSKNHKLARGLAALLQAAIVLDRRSARLNAVRAHGERTTLALAGPGGAVERDLADSLWAELFGPIDVETASSDADDQPDAVLAVSGWDPTISVALPILSPGQRTLLDGGELIGEGARRVLRHFFDKMLAREDGVRKGEDEEDVHQMRVATRRIRASLQVVEPIYERDLVRRYRRGLRRMAEALGAVRDCDVFLSHVERYRATLPDDQRAGLDPLVEAIGTRRADARAELLDDLDRGDYRKFKRSFAEFLTTAGSGLIAQQDHSPAPRVRDFAGSAVWRRYEQWRAYEVAMAHPDDELLHQARIAGKRLRYTLEFFADALGPDVELTLAPLASLQENLGNLQDAVVARQRIHAFGLGANEAVQAYLRARDAERAAQLDGARGLWALVAGADYRLRLAELLAQL